VGTKCTCVRKISDFQSVYHYVLQNVQDMEQDRSSLKTARGHMLRAVPHCPEHVSLAVFFVGHALGSCIGTLTRYQCTGSGVMELG